MAFLIKNNMKAKLTIEEKIAKFFGFGYLVNENSKQIHKLKNKQHNCHIDIISDKRLISKKEANELIEGLYDGCTHCWKEKSEN